MNPSTKVWEQQEGETIKAYAAFCTYRDLGPDRSLDKAHGQKQGQNEGKTGASVRYPKHWDGWASQWRWKERAEAYDAWQEQTLREGRESEQIVQMRAFRDRQLQLNAAGAEAAISLLQKATARLKKVKVDDIPVNLLPAFFRTAATVGGLSSDAEARALGVEELLRELDGQERGDADAEASAEGE